MAGKCHSFGICKKDTSATQYKPKLHRGSTLVPPVNHDEHLICLGRRFDFQMTGDQHKRELIKTISKQMSTNCHSTQRIS